MADACQSASQVMLSHEALTETHLLSLIDLAQDGMPAQRNRSAAIIAADVLLARRAEANNATVLHQTLGAISSTNG